MAVKCLWCAVTVDGTLSVLQQPGCDFIAIAVALPRCHCLPCFDICRYMHSVKAEFQSLRSPGEF